MTPQARLIRPNVLYLRDKTVASSFALTNDSTIARGGS